MGGGEETIAESARGLKPYLADKKAVRQIRFSIKNQRDCGAASAVGAATVAISLLIGDEKVALDAFYVLVIAQGALMYVAQAFTLRSSQFDGQGRAPWPAHHNYDRGDRY